MNKWQFARFGNGFLSIAGAVAAAFAGGNLERLNATTDNVSRGDYLGWVGGPLAGWIALAIARFVIRLRGGFGKPAQQQAPQSPNPTAPRAAEAAANSNQRTRSSL